MYHIWLIVMLISMCTLTHRPHTCTDTHNTYTHTNNMNRQTYIRTCIYMHTKIHTLYRSTDMHKLHTSKTNTSITLVGDALDCRLSHPEGSIYQQALLLMIVAVHCGTFCLTSTGHHKGHVNQQKYTQIAIAYTVNIKCNIKFCQFVDLLLA